MSTWRMGGVVLESGGGCNDPDIEQDIQEGAAHYSYGPPPGEWTVDPKSDWSIHQWASEKAESEGLTLTTDYEPVDSDMPEDVRSYVEACIESSEDEDEGKILY